MTHNHQFPVGYCCLERLRTLKQTAKNESISIRKQDKEHWATFDLSQGGKK